MDNRDEFEVAFIKTLGTDVDVPYLARHRIDGQFYLFDDDNLSVVMDVAWWAWREGQERMTALQAWGADDVLH